MNKIYLLLLAFFLGLAAQAQESTMYVYGDFDGQGWKHYAMSYNTEQMGSPGTHFYVQIRAKANTADFLFKKVVTNPDGGKENTYYRQKNGTTGHGDVNKTNEGYVVTISPNNEGYDFRVSGLTPEAVYYVDLYFTDDANHRTAKIERNYGDVFPSTSIEDNASPEPSGYYFYGDMNRWSTLTNCDKPYSISDLKGNDITDRVFPNGAPQYVSESDLLNRWQFREVNWMYELKGLDGILGTRKDGEITAENGWYYLDFEGLSDYEGNFGRLCGQFKITKGNENNADNWGFDPGFVDDKLNKDYLSSGIQVGIPYGVHKHGNANYPNPMYQNLILANNYIENAVLYFNPYVNGGEGQVFIVGTPVNLYVYYGAVRGDGEEFRAPADWQMNDMSQFNYYANVYGFNDKSYGEWNFGGMFQWDYVSPRDFSYPQYDKYVKDGKIVFNGVEFDHVWRRRIPAGVTHRFPVEFNVWITNDRGDIRFSETRINCDDIWFIEADVELFYRYKSEESTKELKWVVYNAFSNNYTNEGIVDTYDYLFGGRRSWNGDQPLIRSGEWGVAIPVELTDDELPEEYKEYAGTWWKSPVSLPYDFTSNAWALFGDSRGAVFPAERVKAEDEDLESVHIEGRNLYYVVPEEEQNPEILYSHLKGTATLDDATIQINAEFFEPTTFEHGEKNDRYELMTDMRSGNEEILYNFDIYYDGAWVAGTGNKEFSAIYEKLPYYNWRLDQEYGNGQKYQEGYYFIVVKVKYRNKIYTSTDVYPVFSSEK